MNIVFFFVCFANLQYDFLWRFWIAHACLKQVKTQMWGGFTWHNQKLNVQFQDIKYDWL